MDDLYDHLTPEEQLLTALSQERMGIPMMTKKMVQRTAVAVLVGVLSYGGVGTAQASAAAAEAQQISLTSLCDGTQDYQPLRSRDRYERDRRDRDRWERDRRDRDRYERERERERERREDRRRASKSSGKRYSQGSINTAVIAGAVIGAIIAKNI